MFFFSLSVALALYYPLLRPSALNTHYYLSTINFQPLNEYSGSHTHALMCVCVREMTVCLYDFVCVWVRVCGSVGL